MLIENKFKKVKSLIELEDDLAVLLPVKEVFEMIIAVAEFQGNILLLNLA
jgi:hypothetical protein